MKHKRLRRVITKTLFWFLINVISVVIFETLIGSRFDYDNNKFIFNIFYFGSLMYFVILFYFIVIKHDLIIYLEDKLGVLPSKSLFTEKELCNLYKKKIYRKYNKDSKYRSDLKKLGVHGQSDLEWIFRVANIYSSISVLDDRSFEIDDIAKHLNAPLTESNIESIEYIINIFYRLNIISRENTYPFNLKFHGSELLVLKKIYGFNDHSFFLEEIPARPDYFSAIESLENGHEFEEFVANILMQNDYQNVKITKATGDHGIDILASKDGIKYAFQCKLYSSPVGNDSVQQAYSGATFYDAHVPVVITNNNFTKAAEELAKKTNTLLWDGKKLFNLYYNQKEGKNRSESLER